MELEANQVWGLCFCVCIISCLSSFPSVSPCVCVCVAGGVAAPELQPIKHTCTQFIPITLSLKAWSSLHSDAGLLLLHAFVWCFPTRLFMLIASRIYQPATTLSFQPVSASPAHPAVPAGIHLSWSNKLCWVPFIPCSCLLWGPNLKLTIPPGPSWIHTHRWGRIQSGQKASTWTKHHWKKGHSWCARTERGKHYHVCSNCKCRITPSQMSGWTLQYRAPPCLSMISTSAWFQSRIRRVKTWGPL